MQDAASLQDLPRGESLSRCASGGLKHWFHWFFPFNSVMGSDRRNPAVSVEVVKFDLDAVRQRADPTRAMSTADIRWRHR